MHLSEFVCDCCSLHAVVAGNSYYHLQIKKDHSVYMQQLHDVVSGHTSHTALLVQGKGQCMLHYLRLSTKNSSISGHC